MNSQIRILVRAARPRPGVRGFINSKLNFYSVNLEENRIELLSGHSMTNKVGDPEMVMVGDKLYLLGGVDEADLKRILKNNLDSRIHAPETYLGASVFVDSAWKRLPRPHFHYFWPYALAVSDKLYCFGNDSNNLRIEFYDTTCGYDSEWMELMLPAELRDRPLRFPVVADHQNSRILLHLHDTDATYAFSTTRCGTDTWTRLSDNKIRMWSGIAAVSDNAIFFYDYGYSDLLMGFDLSSGESVQVVADFGAVEGVHEFFAMFSLRDGHMCLASRILLESAVVHFLIFTLKRDPHSTNVAHLTALEYQSHVLDPDDRPFGFLPI